MARRRILTAAASAAAVLLIASGCSTAATTGTGGSEGAPVKGGTLKVLANGDVDHIDPQLVAYVPVYSFMRAMSRSLLSYAASDDQASASSCSRIWRRRCPSPAMTG